MACYVLSAWEFGELLTAYKQDQEEEARSREDYLGPFRAIQTPQLMISLKFWCKARELLRDRGEPIPAEFKPLIWLTPGSPDRLPRYHLTTAQGETP